MSELAVICFKDELMADEVLLKLLRLQKEHLIDLEDAAVAIKRPDGQVQIRQSQSLVASGAVSGGLWGTLIGLLFFNPILGAAVGAASGAVSGALTDVGIDDEFVKELGQTIEPGHSALFVLVRSATRDKVLPELSQYEGKVLHTSLSDEAQARLQKALDGEEG